MQFLIFHIGKDRYGLPARRILRVLPLIELKVLPQAPAYVAGLLNLHGTPIPVLDLCRLAGGDACRPWFNTRILLVELDSAKGRHTLGLIAERVTGTERIDPAAFGPPGVAMPAAPYLGAVTAQNGAILQLVEVEALLPQPVRDSLFRQAAEAAEC